MEKKIKYLIFFSIIFLIGITTAELEIGWDEDLPRVRIVTPFKINYSLIEIVNSSDWWDSFDTPDDFPWSSYSGLNDSIDLRTTSINYNATNITTIEGTYDAGDIDSIHIPEDGNTYNVSEDAGASPLLIAINFTDVTSFDSIIGRVYYDGGLGHEIQLEILRSDTGDWENYIDLTDTTDFINFYVPVFDPTQHIHPNGDVAIRFDHVQTGIPTHNFYVDYLNIVDGWTALTVAEHDSLGGRDSRTNHPWAMPQNSSENFTTTGVLTAGEISSESIKSSSGIINFDNENLLTTGYVKLNNLNLYEPTHSKTTTLIPRVNALGGGTLYIDLWGTTTKSLYISHWAGHDIIGLDQDLRHDAASGATFNKITITSSESSVFKSLDIGDDAPTSGEWALDVAPATLGTVIGTDGLDGKGMIVTTADGQASQYAGTSGNGGNIIFDLGLKGIGLNGASDGIKDGFIGMWTATPSYPLEVNKFAGNLNISIYALGNVSATGYMTRTSVFDTTKNPWDYIKNASYYLTDGKIIHERFYGYAGVSEVTDYSRPEIEKYIDMECDENLTSSVNVTYEVCEIINDKIVCNNITETIDTYEPINCRRVIKERTIYPHKKIEEAVSLDAEINLLRQGVYELKQENEMLKNCISNSKDFLELKECVK